MTDDKYTFKVTYNDGSENIIRKNISYDVALDFMDVFAKDAQKHSYFEWKQISECEGHRTDTQITDDLEIFKIIKEES